MSTASVGSATNTGSTNTNTNPTTNSQAKDPLTDKSTFLQLLVAQLKNQDPLNPADGLQFVTQLAQFTNLEQTMEMNSSLKTIRDSLSAASTPPDTKTTTT